MQNETALANAIVVQAADDYRKVFLGYQAEKSSSVEYSKSELNQFFHSSWYKELTTIDGDWLLKKIRIDELEKLLSFYKRFIASIYEKSIKLAFYERERADKKPKLVKMDIPPILMEDFMKVLLSQKELLEKMIEEEKED